MLCKDLVSLMVPFYNAEEYLGRFLESVLKQTYLNIQLILIDDGSTDGSDKIVEKYKEKLLSEITELVCLRQKNGGAASAINTALKHVKGEYLCWADCDDELLPDNIMKKYSFLMAHKDCGLVNCGAKEVDYETGKEIGELVIPISQRSDNIFYQIIKGIPVYSGVFMIRTTLLFDKLSNREIYFNREAGQNYQLLLPVAYNNKCGFIEDVLYVYYVRADSHSHAVNYEKIYQRTYVREKVLEKVLVFMPQDEKKKILMNIHDECVMQRFDISFCYNDKVSNNQAYDELSKNQHNLKTECKHIIINNKMLNKIYRLKGKAQ